MFVRSSDGFNILIFDRWGKVVFESNDVNYGWDGILKVNPQKLESTFM